MKKIKLSTKDNLAMYRNTFYSAMGVVNGEELPTDYQCIQWLHWVIGLASGQIPHQVIVAAADSQVWDNSKNPNTLAPLSVEVRRFDVGYAFPDWRLLPKCGRSK